MSETTTIEINQDAAIATVRYAINCKIIDKTDPQKLSYAEAFKPVQGTLKDLAAHIGRGHPWMPAILDDGKPREQQSSNYAEVLALDIDNQVKVKGEAVYHHEMTMDEAIAHPFISQHAGLGIPSASCKPEWNKFRLVFRLPRPLTNWKEIRICNDYLAQIVGAGDSSCKDASRFFFGAKGRSPFLLNEAVTLPENFIDEALAWNAAMEAAMARTAEIAAQQLEEWRADHTPQDEDALLLQALEAIDPDCEYNDWLAVGMARADDDWWFEIWKAWSSKGSKYKPGECEKKWKSFRGKQASPATIFGIAKRYGWRFPKRNRGNRPRMKGEIQALQRRSPGVSEAESGGETNGTKNNQKPLLIEFSEKEDQEPIPKLMSQSKVAAILAEEYQPILACDLKSDCLYRYEVESPGVWTKEYDRALRGVVQSELDSRGAFGMYSSGYIKSIADLMATYLAVRSWDEAPDLLPMQNGVLQLSTMELLPHNPGYRFTWQLPYEYNPDATCEPIQDWLTYTQEGDSNRVELLRAYLKAIVTGRSDLQRYLECLGPGGSGKSTFANLAIALVGINNVAITTLEQLERNRFETANLKHKRLLYVTDSEKYGGSVAIFKSITGGDPVRYEEKNKQQGESFVPRLMALVASNEPVQSNDYTSGLERRRITVPFLRAVAPTEQRDLLTITHQGMSGEFLPYLPGLLNWVLAMPDDRVKALVKQTSLSVPTLNKWKAETLVATNPLAEWLDECCVLLPASKTYVGVAEKIRITDTENGLSTSTERYKNATHWLYANYCAFAEKTGSKPVKSKRFSELLLDLIANQLKKPIEKHRDRSGAFLTGIEIRDTTKHANIPTPVTDVMLDCDGCVTAEMPTDAGCDGCDGFFETQPGFEEKTSTTGISTCKGNPPLVSSAAVVSESQLSNPDNPSHPSQPTPARVSPVTHPSPNPSHPDQFDPTSLKKGDRVMTPRGVGEVNYRTEIDGVPAVYVNGDTWSQPFPVEQLTAIAP